VDAKFSTPCRVAQLAIFSTLQWSQSDAKGQEFMPTIRVWKSLLERARDRAVLTSDERSRADAIICAGTGDIAVDPNDLPLPMARALLDEGKLKPNERGAVALRVLGMRAGAFDHQQLYETVIGGPIELGSILLAASTGKPNAELLWNDRWYPVKVSAEIHEEDKTAKSATIAVKLGIGGSVLQYKLPVNPVWFQTSDGQQRETTVIQILEQVGFRRLQIEVSKYNLRVVSAERLAAQSGKQMLACGAVLELSQGWHSDLSEIPLGTAESPRRVVVESTLTDPRHREEYYPSRIYGSFDEKVSRLPLVRVFSLDTKRYVHADVDDLREYEYDPEAITRLILPPEMKKVLGSVFRASRQELFADHVRHKHGGIVILACGPSGVGKTLTAEVYAELTERPLYVLEFGELGTTVQEIEHNLAKVFARVVKWSAVLQFDECEVFLAKRGDDLQRSAIVGIFLRMLDYYEGLLFLTTNRPEVLDHAVHSRVMLRLDYPELTTEARIDVWRSMLRAAGLHLPNEQLDQVATEPLNGRQIRNRVRLAKIIFGPGELDSARLRSIAQFNSMPNR
jgi:ATPase family associated with various cellular activities (AAA)